MPHKCIISTHYFVPEYQYTIYYIIYYFIHFTWSKCLTSVLSQPIIPRLRPQDANKQQKEASNRPDSICFVVSCQKYHYWAKMLRFFWICVFHLTHNCLGPKLRISYYRWMMLEGNLLILLLARYVQPSIIDGQFENLAQAHILLGMDNENQWLW